MGNLPDGIHDLDSHEMIPTHLWAEKFGAGGDKIAKLTEFLWDGPFGKGAGDNSPKRDDATDIDGEISPEIVWNVKGCKAPGAISMERRLEVLDTMGVRRQLIFPGFGILSDSLPYLFELAANDPELRELWTKGAGVDPLSLDADELGLAAMEGYNDWVLEALKTDPDRLRLVAMLRTDSLDEMMTEARRLISGGVRALVLPVNTPPAGMSPANEDLDPFWSLVEEADVAVTVHVGVVEGFMKSSTWREARIFEVGLFRSIELPENVDIYLLSTVRMAVENYLTTMVLGGVFDRHPKLRFGAIEMGAQWVGPLMEGLDMWASIFPSLSSELSLRPSEYFARNIRVTPFHFEPVDDFIERYPFVSDVLVYSSDYPHVEGGKDVKRRFYDRLERLGDDVVDKYFRTNGELLVPA